MLLDANLLIYAVNEQATEHEAAKEWLTEHLNGPRRVGIPWQSIGAFLRIVTHPRAFANPLGPRAAWERVTDWLAAPASWLPEPGRDHATILGGLISSYEISGNVIPDAMLAALAIEHGLALCSSDTDFARFSELKWINPLR